MALNALNIEVACNRTATTIFDHIAQGFRTGRLAHHAIRDFLTARHQGVYHAHRAIFRSRFLIGSNQ